MSAGYERIVVSGSPEEIGRAYGSAARARIARSRDAYAAVFLDATGWDWPRVRAAAERFVDPIRAYHQKYVREMQGIADGAGLELLDIVALNVRSEIIFAADASRAAEATRAFVPECSSLALTAERTSESRMLVGQTWDWLPHALDTAIVLEVHQDEGPDYVTFVEAGLLAKVGMNSSGIGLCANALVSDLDRGEPGVPFHVLLRAIFDAESAADALLALGRCRRAGSGNYLIADRDGVVLDVEAMPGGHREMAVLRPEDGRLVHTNHFISPRTEPHDVAATAMPDSHFRLERLRQLTREETLGREDIQAAFADHALYPFGVCTHPDPRQSELHQWRTIAGLVMDVRHQKLWLAAGYPCSEPFVEYDLAAALAKPSPIRLVKEPA